MNSRFGGAAVCALLLVCAGVAAWFVPAVTEDERAWHAARPCAAGAGGDDCLRTVPAVIERTEPHQPKKSSYLYFTGGRPTAGLEVSFEAAESFEAGDRVELTYWRGRVMTVSGRHYVWHEHVVTGGSLAVLAAGLALGAGYPGARLLVRLRGRRRPRDEVPPSSLPFLVPVTGTAVWLLPLCHRYPTSLFGSTAAVTWWAVGAVVSLGLSGWAWRATRVRVPGEAAVREPAGAEDVFVRARFLEPTAYNPHLFGTHIVLGADGPAVTPHSGPGRFGARTIPAERLTVKSVRRARGEEGELVPHSWHIAELDDGGRPVRLAADPADLALVLRSLSAVRG
ncbi:PH domain-containing protein [Streptomyces sp. NPDC001135]